jgi:hypothetical protein
MNRTLMNTPLAQTTLSRAALPAYEPCNFEKWKSADFVEQPLVAMPDKRSSQ